MNIFLKSLLGSVLLWSLSVNCGFTQEKYVSLLAPVNSVALIPPQFPSTPNGASFYSWTGANPNWKIAQWNMPGKELSSFQNRVENAQLVSTSSSPEASVTITKIGSTTQILLNQNGKILPCTSASTGKPLESDLLFSPNGERPRPPGKPGMTFSAKASPSLSSFSQLIFSANLSVSGGAESQNEKCPFNVGKTGIGVTLTDLHAAPPQTIFYQLAFSKFCGLGTPQQVAFCNANHVRLQVFHKGFPFGVDDFLPPLGQPLLKSGEARNISVDILPRIKQLFALAPPQTDKDLSHWVVGGIYIGQSIYGDMILNSSWKNFQLIATQR